MRITINRDKDLTPFSPVCTTHSEYTLNRWRDFLHLLTVPYSVTLIENRTEYVSFRHHLCCRLDSCAYGAQMSYWEIRVAIRENVRALKRAYLRYYSIERTAFWARTIEDWLEIWKPFSLSERRIFPLPDTRPCCERRTP